VKPARDATVAAEAGRRASGGVEEMAAAGCGLLRWSSRRISRHDNRRFGPASSRSAECPAWPAGPAIMAFSASPSRKPGPTRNGSPRSQGADGREWVRPGRPNVFIAASRGRRSHDRRPDRGRQERKAAAVWSRPHRRPGFTSGHRDGAGEPRASSSCCSLTTAACRQSADRRAGAASSCRRGSTRSDHGRRDGDRHRQDALEQGGEPTP